MCTPNQRAAANRQIRLLNEKVGVKDPSDLTHDIETYKWLNLDPIQNKLCWAKGDLEKEECRFGEVNRQ